jgi:hypothetical protein
MKRVVLYSLIVASFWSLFGQYVPVDTHTQSLIYSVDSSQPTSGKSYEFDSSAFSKILVDFRVEVEEEEEDHYHYSGNQSSKLLSLPLVRNETSSVSLFSPKKIIKLYILFHSWKSFLDF